MPTRSGDFSLTNLSGMIAKVPRVWGKVTQTLEFTENYVETTSVEVDVTEETLSLVGDSPRGGERNKMGGDKRMVKSLSLPFFTLDAALTRLDILNLRKAGTEKDPETLASARLNILNKLRRYEAGLQERIVCDAVFKGASYAPNGYTAQYDYFDVFETSRVTQGFDLGNESAALDEYLETVRGSIVDNAKDGGTDYEIVCWASPQWFNLFINHVQVKGAYDNYANANGVNPNRDRPAGNRSSGREFFYKGINFIEYRGTDVGGNALVPAGKAYFMPLGIPNMFEAVYGPSDLKEDSMIQDMYVVEVSDHRRTEIESETARMVINKRPELVVEALSTAP